MVKSEAQTQAMSEEQCHDTRTYTVVTLQVNIHVLSSVYLRVANLQYTYGVETHGGQDHQMAIPS